MQILDGKKLADELISTLPQIKGILAIITVGDDPASKVYVRNKIKAAAKIGMNGINYRYPVDISFNDLLDHINELNDDPKVLGIIVQKPLPKELDNIVNFVVDYKDVDCGSFQSYSRVMAEDFSGFLPATPKGICTLLDHYNIDVEGKNVVIIGRSKLVGTPLAIMLKHRNATVTICHSKTKNLKEYTRRADIIVSAVGKAKFIDHTYIQYPDYTPLTGYEWKTNYPVIIDVAICRDENGKLCGDVDFDDVAPYVSYITPVPGGVGPMTVYSLIEQCIKLFN